MKVTPEALLAAPVGVASTQCAAAATLPLWLSEPEAEILVSLCLTSLGYAGSAEHELFVKLGEYLRAFRR